MTKVLAINSSALGAASTSRQLVAELIEQWQQAEPGLSVVWRDLGSEPPPHLRAETVGALRRGEAETPAEQATRALSDQLIDELRAADVLVLGAPMYNFGIPTPLKAWFDHVLRAGASFRYTATGSEGLLTGKRAVVIETRGGFYSDGPMHSWDAQEPHLRALLAFIGLTEVAFIRAERLALGADARSQSLAAASAAVRAQVASELSASA
jgi:FMN-dependent NADH-azoreductase